jgi:pentatricopeptide repeat protein
MVPSGTSRLDMSAPHTLSRMTTQAGKPGRKLNTDADEALIEAAFRSGNFDKAERLFREVLSLAERGGDRETEALAIFGVGMTHHYRNIGKLIDNLTPDKADVAAEEELMRRALTLALEIGDSAGTARAMFGMGLVYQVLRGDWTTAMRYFWPAYGLAEALEESGDLYGRSEIHRHVGFYYLVEDIRPKEAIRQLSHSLVLRERLRDPRRIPSALVALGEAEMVAGNPPRAVELFSRAVTLARETDLQPWWTQDAEQNLRTAKAALTEPGSFPATPPDPLTPQPPPSSHSVDGG